MEGMIAKAFEEMHSLNEDEFHNELQTFIDCEVCPLATSMRDKLINLKNEVEKLSPSELMEDMNYGKIKKDI